jgi:hypothetical protein
MKSLKLFITFIFSVAFLSSCLDYNSPEMNYSNVDNIYKESSQAVVNAKIDNKVEAAISKHIDALKLKSITGTQKVFAPSWPIVSEIESNSEFKKYSVDFGPDSTFCYVDDNDDKFYGIVEVTKYANKSRNSKAVDFGINDMKIDFERTITVPETGLTVTTDTEIIRYKNGKESNKTINRTRRLIREGKTDWKTFTYEYTGNSNGKLANGESFSRNVTKELLKKDGYIYFVSGTVEVNINGNLTIIDFGNGTKDNVVTYTTNGVTSTRKLNWGNDDNDYNSFDEARDGNSSIDE